MKKKLAILLLEDDAADGEILEKELKRGNIDFTIQRVDTESDFIRELREFKPDIVLADYSLPSFDGMSALKITVENYPDMPFIFISGTVGEEFAVDTLKNGATDYVMKGRMARLNPAIERAITEKERQIELRHADETLRKAEEKFRMLVERMPAMTYLTALDEKFTTLYVSPQVEEMLGFTPRECLDQGDLWYRHLFPDDREKVLEEMTRSIAGGKPFKFDYRMIRRNGEIRWFHDENIVIRDRAGNALYLEGVNFDITDSKRAQHELKESEEKFRQITSSIDGVFYMITPGLSRMLYISPQYERIWGRPVGELYNNPAQWYEFIHPDDFELTLSAYKESAGQPLEMVFRIIRPDKSIRWIRSRNYPLFDETGNLYRITGIAEDITEIKHAEAEMRKLSTVVQQNPDMVIVFNIDGTIEYVNKAAESLTGFDREEMVGTTRDEIKIEQFSGSRFDDIWHTLRSGETYEDIINYRKKSGEALYLHTMLSPLKDAQGKITHVIARGRDITEKKQIEEKLNFMANYDMLTGLPNRRLFIDRTNQAIARTALNEKIAAVLVINMDRFKFINEAYGHPAGDIVLKEASERIQTAIRKGDTVARLGSDEFGVVLFDVAHAKDVVIVIEKIFKFISSPVNVDKVDILSTTSIGVALYPNDGQDAEALIQNADIAASRAKKEGGNSFMYFTADLNRKASEFILMEKHLFNALSNDEFEMHFQPYFDVSSRKIVGMESLMRWKSREMGVVSPAIFIPILEETGMIVPVGEWIFRSICRQINDWRSRGFHVPPIAINVSAVQIRQKDFISRIQGILNEFKIDASDLIFEITESIFVEDFGLTETALEQVRSMGMPISIDDFGTGYSSLSYLKRLRVNNLKIDISFIRDIGTDPDSASIVTAIISMAHNLGLRTIAEGIETEEQFNILRILKCDNVQGYLLSKPLPAEDVEKLMEHMEPQSRSA